MTGRMDRVRALLRTRTEICSLSSLYGDALANGRNDVSELRRRGWLIESNWREHEAGAPPHCHYRLVREGPAKPPPCPRTGGGCAGCWQCEEQARQRRLGAEQLAMRLA